MSGTTPTKTYMDEEDGFKVDQVVTLNSDIFAVRKIIRNDLKLERLDNKTEMYLAGASK